MDRTEKFLQKELARTRRDTAQQLDLDQILQSTHGRIKSREKRRKTLYSAPVVLLLALMVYVVLPDQGKRQLHQGSELFMAGWEQSWTEEKQAVDSSLSDDLYDQSVDYLFDAYYYTYADEAADLMDESDLSDLVGFFKEA